MRLWERISRGFMRLWERICEDLSQRIHKDLGEDS